MPGKLKLGSAPVRLVVNTEEGEKLPKGPCANYAKLVIEPNVKIFFISCITVKDFSVGFGASNAGWTIHTYTVLREQNQQRKAVRWQ